MKIDGMMCGMCEAHVNDAIRAAVSPKKVNSSHSKGITEIISESELDSAVLREAVEKDGYKVLDMHQPTWMSLASRLSTAPR